MPIFFTQLYWMVIALGGYLPYLVKKTIKHAVSIHGPFTLRTSVNACINNDAPVNTTSHAPQNLDVTSSWSGATVLTSILNVNKTLSIFHTVFTSTQSMGLFANKNACNFYGPQRSCGKVTFSQVSVILFTGGGGWCLVDTPPAATAADGTHAGMLSCFASDIILSNFFSKFDKVIGLPQEQATTENICYFTTLNDISSYSFATHLYLEFLRTNLVLDSRPKLNKNNKITLTLQKRSVPLI